MIDVLASERHFIDHTVPVWRELPEDRRGSFFTVRELIPYLESLGVEGQLWRQKRDDALLLVASAGDVNRSRRVGRIRVAYMEHGAGQSYGGDKRTAKHPSYAGGEGRDHVALILAPNDHAAKRWLGRYPDTPVEVIGATRPLPPPASDAAPLLAISFHWAGPTNELRNALPHYHRALASLAKHLPVIGHGHPRFAASLSHVYRRAGIEWVSDVLEVARRATVYAVDNSSTLWELGRTRPVIALDAPWYRDYIFHGLRFWDSIPGPHVPGPDELRAHAERLLAGETSDERIERERVVDRVIPHLDGAARAARLLIDLDRGRTDATGRERR